MCLCSCMHITSTFWSIADAVSSASCLILFKVLTLNITICIVRLYFSNFCFSLLLIFRTLGPGLQAQQDAPFFTRVKSDEVWTSSSRVNHGNLSMAVFILIYRSHPDRWAAVVHRPNCLILAVVSWDSFVQNLVRHGVNLS